LIFGSLLYFYFRYRLYGQQDGRFCLIFPRTAQQSVAYRWYKLTSSSKPCVYCRIVQLRASRGNLTSPTGSEIIFSWLCYPSRLWHTVSSVCLSSVVCLSVCLSVCDVLYCGETVRPS